MKALSTTKTKVVVEMSGHDLYTIFNSLNTVVKQYELLDFEVLDRGVEVVDEVLKRLTNMLMSITDDKGDFIPS